MQNKSKYDKKLCLKCNYDLKEFEPNQKWRRFMISITINTPNEITINDVIRGQDDYTEIKNSMEALIEKGIDSIKVNILESSSVNSSVIGYFMKVINKDKIALQINVKDQKLYKIFDDLNLISVFNIKKV